MADQDFPFITTGIALGLAGAMIEKRSSNAVASTTNEAHKAEYQAWTTGGTLIGDLGSGLVVYGIYKRSPGWGIAAGLGLLAITVIGTKNPEKHMVEYDKMLGGGTKTGWEPWERREWERRRLERERRFEEPWRQW